MCTGLLPQPSDNATEISIGWQLAGTELSAVSCETVGEQEASEESGTTAEMGAVILWPTKAKSKQDPRIRRDIV
jgi:hypothetical protein